MLLNTIGSFSTLVTAIRAFRAHGPVLYYDAGSYRNVYGFAGEVVLFYQGAETEANILAEFPAATKLSVDFTVTG